KPFALVLCACSSKPHAPEETKTAHDLARDAAPLGPYRTDAQFAKGDVQIRVEWHDVPTAARTSPGRTTCGTPRHPAVAPTATWGVPDAIVAIEVDHGRAMSAPDARVVLEHCALSPRVLVAGPSLAIASAADAPAKLQLARMSAAQPLGAGANNNG